MNSLLLFVESLVPCAHGAETRKWANKDTKMKYEYDSCSFQGFPDTPAFKSSLQLFHQVHQDVSGKVYPLRGELESFTKKERGRYH